MSNDPIGELFGDVASATTPTPQPASASNPIATAAVLVLLLVLIFAAWQKFGPTPGPNPPPKPDDQEQVEPQPKIVGKTLIFIHERDPQPIEHDLLLREMPDYTAGKKLQFRAFDDDTTDEPVPKVVAFAKSKGIDPPCVVLTDANDKPARAIKWPSSKEGLGDLFK